MMMRYLVKKHYLFLLAIPRKQIYSLRVLNAEHIPLLEKIQNVGKEKLAQKFNIGTNQIHAYLHYRAACPHLLIHFSHIEHKDYTGKLINLSEVIQNIKFKSDYYEKTVLEIIMEETADDAIKAQITDLQKANLKSLKPFKPIKILQRDDKKKELVILGQFEGEEAPRIVKLEKIWKCDIDFKTFSFPDQMQKVGKEITNVEWKEQDILTSNELSLVNSVIFPQELQSDFEKKKQIIVSETYQDYLQSKKILELPEWLKSFPKVTFEDLDFDVYDVSAKYKAPYLLIVANSNGSFKNVKSLRDLTKAHITKLESIRTKGKSLFKESKQVDEKYARVFVKYPSDFHRFHIHINSIDFNDGLAENMHLLSKIINHLNLLEKNKQVEEANQTSQLATENQGGPNSGNIQKEEEKEAQQVDSLEQGYYQRVQLEMIIPEDEIGTFVPKYCVEQNQSKLNSADPKEKST